jgi:hypothetical protein
VQLSTGEVAVTVVLVSVLFVVRYIQLHASLYIIGRRADAHIRSDSYSNFGGSYTVPDGIVLGSDAAKQYFAGTHSFRVAVFQILVSGVPDSERQRTF